MGELDQMMRNVSPHAQAFDMLREMEEVERQRISDIGGAPAEIPEIQLVFRTDGLDPRIYNPPASNEVAAIFMQDANGLVVPPALVIKNRGGGLRLLSTLDSYLDALTYPIFWPTGMAGWRPYLPFSNPSPNDKRTVVSRREFYAYHLADRPGTFNPIHYGCKLMQEYIVVAYARVESDRLLWNADDQAQLHGHCYAVQAQARQIANDVRAKYEPVRVLPATYPGSPRITANPNWKEVKEACAMLQPDGTTIQLTASDRPTIVARVFHLKLKALIADLKRGIFGKTAAHIYVIEYQKRGLPHAHLLVTLAHGHKLSTPELLDSVLSAEIPDPDHEADLYELVKAHMIHGPCTNGHWSPCLKNGVCNKKFPKDFQQSTTFMDDGYAKLKRPNNGRIVDFGGGKVADNQFVVPYSPYLLLKYRAHINAECVAGIRAVKYLYKYVYKGLDRAEVQVVGEQLIVNEIEEYINARYVSPPEAASRLLAKNLQGKSHTVQPLHVHLPGERLGPEAEDDMEAEADEVDVDVDANAVNNEPFAAEAQPGENVPPLTKSTLLAYFKLNGTDPFSRTLSYLEVPEHYRWDRERGKWLRRVANRSSVGRLHPASVTKPELCRLRLLLLHVKGATKFEDLRRDPHNPLLLHPTFTAACVSRGLVVEDSEWRMCLSEAADEKMPYQLRRLFVTILLQNSPSDPLALWEQFKMALSEDFRRSAGNVDRGIRRALRDVKRQMLLLGVDFEARFPMFPRENAVADADEVDVDAELQMANHYYATLNDEQKAAVDTAIKHLEDLEGGRWSKPRCLFIGGEGGTGKSHCYKCIYHMMRARGYAVSIMASTGAAATVLPKAKTAHKTFGLPVPLFADSECMISLFSPPAELRNSVCFLWDEITVASRFGLEAVDRMLRVVRGCPERPFGDAIFVVGGDWKQTHPILPRATPAEAIDLCVKKSQLWGCFEERHLVTNVRAQADPQWTHFLRQVGNGDGLQGDEGEINLPAEIVTDASLVDTVFAELFTRQWNELELADYLSARAIIAPLNKTCDDYNDEVIRRFHGRSVEHLSVDEVVRDTLEAGEMYPTEFLNSLDPSDVPPHRLTLKEGCIVMLLRNLRVHDGLCNGSRFLCTKVGRRFVELMHISGPSRGQKEFLPRITLESAGKDLPFKFRRHQYPLRLAYSFSINKAQGQTLTFCGVDLSFDVFAHGQLYVALSRVRTSDTIKVKMRPGKQTVRNVVYKSLLRD